MPLPDRFAEHLARFRLPAGPVLVAVSGGVDSVVLLDLVSTAAAPLGLAPIVAHVDHGIHPESGAVAGFVEGLARGRGLPVLVGRLALGAGVSETRARAARFRWLEQAARESGARHILLAHQADDQSETILMRLLRGSGPAGLAGMPARRGMIVRPLLPFSRRTLLRYAEVVGLAWWDDPANVDPRHLRSWLRQEVLPRLADRVPDVAPRLRAAGRQAAADRRAWRDALRGWPGLEYRRDAGVVSLSWSVLASFPGGLRLALAQALLRDAGGPAGPARLRRALKALAGAASGASADLAQGWRLALDFGRLRVLGPAAVQTPGELPLVTNTGEAVWGAWRVRWAPDTAPERQTRDGPTAWFIPGKILLRPWRQGDRVAPLGGRGHRLAVRCFQDAHVPRTERAGWPVLEHEGELAWIPGVCRSSCRVPAAGAPALRVEVEHRG